MNDSQVPLRAGFPKSLATTRSEWVPTDEGSNKRRVVNVPDVEFICKYVNTTLYSTIK